ncbi:hypothetical protein COMA1_60086 [Candidatus Nitrospira nitrosa]|uniref:Uncharacterized protein n=1 Tax=Candidatus Nitrospira nitrosa TaxID=1742972 RepID=A0A0S4LNH5_9BACT|nr:hypothetical protein COMA1_60086 [Candidatus Nitrospira nitrosa]
MPILFNEIFLFLNSNTYQVNI